MRPLLWLLVLASVYLTDELSAAEFLGLGPATGGWETEVRSMSADGAVLAGMTLKQGAVGQAFVWTEANGVETLGVLPGGDHSFANRVSGDGRVVVGTSTAFDSGDGLQAFRWTRESGMQAMGDLEGGVFDSQATGVSFDGAVIVGGGNATGTDYASGYEAFRWTQQDGMQSLGVADWAEVSGARDVSGDGQTILVGDNWHSLVSGNRYQSYLLRPGEEPLLIDLPQPDMVANFGRAISRDGRVVVGNFHRLAGNTLPYGAFWWHSDYGLIDVGALPSSSFSRSLYDVSADGSVAVGQEHVGGQPVATIWDEFHGVRRLDGVLAADPAVAQQLEGWHLEYAFAVSDNGRIVAGNGIDPQGGATAWRAVLDAEPTPILLPGDATLDATVDLADFASLKAHFGGKGFWYQGDFDRDTNIDVDDFGILKANFAKGSAVGVPEPSGLELAAGLALLMVGGSVVARRRIPA